VTLAGALAGVGASLALGRYASSLLHGISATDAVAIATALVLMLAVSTLASLTPALRAAGVDPAVALRSE